MQSQDLRQMFSEQQRLLTKLEVRHSELARTDEDATKRFGDRLEDVLRHVKESQSDVHKRRTQLRQFKCSLTRTRNHLNDLSKKMDEESERKEVALKEAKESGDFYQGTSNTLSVQAKIANDELCDGRKMATDILQAVNTDIIDDALKKKNRQEKSKQQQPVVGIKMMGSIDVRPWSTEFKRRHADSDDCDEKMLTELSIWESLIRNPGFCPFTTVQVGEDKWERKVNYHDEKLSFLKKNLGEEVCNSVTTALMEIEQYNSSGRYAIPLPWIFEESRMATLKEIIAHLGSVVEASVGTAPPGKKSRVSAKFSKASSGKIK